MTYSKNEKALIFMSQFDFFTSTKFQQMFELIDEPGVIFDLDIKQLSNLKSILRNNYELFLDTLVNFNQDKFFSDLESRGIYCTTILSDNYPHKLTHLKNPPYVLYCVGNFELLKNNCISVVGTRSPSNYGKIVTDKFSKKLAENNFTIISGLATGVDKVAHEAALEVGGNTVAVLGGGFDHIFPALNINLAREIAKKGLILTEYYTKIKPTKYSFPTRNRIIAALADAILITEAKNGSGSLYTKEYADELGIDTYCVPGNITSEKSDATNNLIKIGSCYCATDASDILKNFGIQSTKYEKKQTQQLSIEELAISELLKDGEKDFEFLQEKTKYSPQTLNYNLTTMEIRGIIKKLAGNTYILC